MRTRSLSLSVVAVAATLALSACGGGGDTAATPAATTPSATASGDPGADGPDGFAEYRDCLAANGATLPEAGMRPSGMPSAAPPSGMPSGAPPSAMAGGPGAMPLPDGIDQETFDSAQAACSDLAPQPGAGPAPDVDASALTAFTTCLSDNGVEVAEGADPMRDLDRNDATVAAAWDTCAPLLPQPS